MRRSRSRAARRSGSSASPDAARPRPRSRCWASSARAAASAPARSPSAGATSRTCPAASCRRCAGDGSASSRRTRRPRCPRGCASATSSPRRWRCTTSAARAPIARDARASCIAHVRLPDPERTARKYPHQLSGGQQQRVVIAMALACDPELIVLDEPTTGLDVTTQAQILDLLRRLRAELGMAMLYVTHNLGVVAAVCDRVGVMYAGELVEDAPVRELFSHPRHPYTRGLIDAVPSVAAPHRSRDVVLRGLLKRNELPKGCRFAPRCDFAEEACFEQRQVLRPVAEAHEVACRRVEEVERLTAGRSSASSYVPLVAAADEPLLDVAGLSITYDRPRRRIARAPRAAARGRAGRHVRPARARDVLARRRVGQRQVDDRAHRRRPAAAPLGPAHVRGPRPRRDGRVAQQGRAARDPDRPPEPGRVAQPAPARAPDRRPAARALLRAARQGAPGRRREGARGRAARRGLREPLSRTSSRAASGSASRSPARSRPSRG